MNGTRSTASSAAAESAAALRGDSLPMPDLIKLYLFALRSGDRPLARALARALRSDGTLLGSADDALQGLPRGPGRWSADAARLVSRVASRLR